MRRPAGRRPPRCFPSPLPQTRPTGPALAAVPGGSSEPDVARIETPAGIPVLASSMAHPAAGPAAHRSGRRSPEIPPAPALDVLDGRAIDDEDEALEAAARTAARTAGAE